MEVSEEMLQVLDQSAGPMGLAECLEILHQSWPSVLRYVTNSNINLTMTHENGQSFEYVNAPIEILKSSDEDTLDQKIQFMLGDLGESVPDLLDLFIFDEEIKPPLVTYRAYFIGQYDQPIFIAKNLELTSITRDWQGSRCESEAPGLNDRGNGELYSASTDESLSGFY